MLILKKRDPEQWIKVPVADGEISLKIRRPTYAEMVECLGIEHPAAFQLRNNVIDWRDAFDEQGQPIPFSQESFATLCESFPRVMVAAAVACHKAYEGMAEIDAKN